MVNRILFNFLGYSAKVFIEVSLVNSTVELGKSFEVAVTLFWPTLSSDGFRGLWCGCKAKSGPLLHLATWDPYRTSPGMAVRSEVIPDFRGRLAVRDVKVLRINNAKFTDEGKIFYCQLFYENKTTGQDAQVIKLLKLEAVYGNLMILSFSEFWFYISFSSMKLLTLFCTMSKKSFP